ncbi:MAG: hypothetical protein BGO98_46160 [Myxococcales bacterium 68-20]|nr:MAG: hypothetical protein BGO98_46160 [Myxococcales bacterium 68-20]
MHIARFGGVVRRGRLDRPELEHAHAQQSPSHSAIPRRTRDSELDVAQAVSRPTIALSGERARASAAS